MENKNIEEETKAVRLDPVPERKGESGTSSMKTPASRVLFEREGNSTISPAQMASVKAPTPYFSKETAEWLEQKFEERNSQQQATIEQMLKNHKEQMDAVTGMMQDQQATIQKLLTTSGIQKKSKSRVKVSDAPKFAGGKSDDVMNWTFLMETLFKEEIEESKQKENSSFVDSIIVYLTDTARDWFVQYKKDSEAEGSIRSWMHFKKSINNRFKQADYLHKLLHRMCGANTQAKTTTMEGQIAIYQKIVNEIRDQDPEELIDAVVKYHFIKSLPAEAMKFVEDKLPKTMAEAIKHAERFPATNLLSAGKKGKNPPATTKKKSQQGSKKFKCYTCGKPGHKSTACTATAEEKKAHKLRTAETSA